jgi:hypothetical protein
MLVTHYLAGDPGHPDPFYNICSDAILCILFRFGPGRNHTGRKICTFNPFPPKKSKKGIVDHKLFSVIKPSFLL